ncbi:hypothetical protein ACLI09_09695 [Flavobacterium sp. RHBU_24]|uniref:hypothetical protein n=1 Tax=Flavobacterium sp. RHBU_24 TaxID=3391185 RepID=UPI003984635D
MESFQIDIINPKALNLLKELAELKLIAIKPANENKFLNVVEKLRNKALKNVPSAEEIAAEVEAVRSERYAK